MPGATLTGWRIVKEKYVAEAWNGEGARLHGGRWNSAGTALVYTSQNASLAVLEMVVNFSKRDILAAYRLGAAHFDPSLVESVDEAALPPNWRDPVIPGELQRIGDAWARAKTSVVLRVPSAVMPTESNFLFNPSHPDFGALRLDAFAPFDFDTRLLPPA